MSFAKINLVRLGKVYWRDGRHEGRFWRRHLTETKGPSQVSGHGIGREEKHRGVVMCSDKI